MIIFIINVFVIFVFVLLFLIVKKMNKNWTKVEDYMGIITHTVNSVRYGNLSTKIEKVEFPNYKNLSDSINRMIETLNDREKMIVEYQHELTRQNKFLEAVINSLSDGILIVDEHFKILRVTPKVAQWFEQSEKKLINKPISEYIQPKDNIKFDKFNDSEVFIIQNTKETFEATTMKLKLDDRKKRYVIIIKNITNEKELEKLREDFIATLTHDLKVPIVAESNILEFLITGKFGEVSEKQFEAINNMKSCNQELLELVQILLETYKIDDSGIELEKENILLDEFLREIVDDMAPIAEKSSINISIEILDNITLNADKIHMRRVFKNLIQNAISHSDSNKDIIVKVNREDSFACISIIDFGKGIPKDEVDKIFNKYYSTAKKFRKIGTGLGLYFSQQVVKAHGGEITVSSEENVHTEFCIKIPF